MGNACCLVLTPRQSTEVVPFTKAQNTLSAKGLQGTLLAHKLQGLFERSKHEHARVLLHAE